MDIIFQRIVLSGHYHGQVVFFLTGRFFELKKQQPGNKLINEIPLNVGYMELQMKEKQIVFCHRLKHFDRKTSECLK